MSECFDSEINVTFDNDSNFQVFIVGQDDFFVCDLKSLSDGIDVDPSTSENVIDIKVDFDGEDDFKCSVFDDGNEFECDMGEFMSQMYDGAYEITPTSYEQMLPTKHKTLIKNVVVHKTPYYETTNEAGGYTATIL